MPSPRELFQVAYHAANQRQFDQAKKAYFEALELDPEYSMAWNNVGWILYDQEQEYQEAEKCYQLALKWDEKNYIAWNNYGILQYRQKKDYKHAEKCWKRSVKINANFEKAWQNLAVLYQFQIIKPKTAKKCIEKVEELKKLNPPTLNSHDSEINLTQCLECGNKLLPHHQICEHCGKINSVN